MSSMPRREFLRLSFLSLCLSQIKIPFIRQENYGDTQGIDYMWFGYSQGQGNFTA